MDQPMLQSGISYGYDLIFEQGPSPDAFGHGPTSTNLSLLGMLNIIHPLGYTAGKLPTFSLPPPTLEGLKLLHGSCRKPHGGGRDMLALADNIIVSDLHPDRRPHQLILTGDQIYSDDVALPLLGTIQATARELLSWSHEEEISYSKGTITMNSVEVAPGSARRYFIKTYSDYTSEQSDGHLIFLAESYLMYLMIWSPELWPRSANGDFDLDDGTSALDKRDKDNQSLSATSTEQRKNALEFAKTLPQVRRALANLPVAMIFDDHEVTDDWFINRNWHENVCKNSCGQRMMRNALLAYAIFQDWGNQPYNYDGDKLGHHLLDMVTWLRDEGDIRLNANPNALDCQLGINPLSTVCSTPRMNWHYRLAGPAYQIIVLDTRTWRTYPVTQKGEAVLIGADARRAQINAWFEAGLNLTTIIVSAAPVVSVPIEEVARRALAAELGPEAADLESWDSDRVAFEGFLNELAVFHTVVLISGDVHYAYTNHIAYFRDDTTYPPARIVQLCSSALKNQGSMAKLLAKISHPLPCLGWLGFSEDLQADLVHELRDLMLSGIGELPRAPDALLRCLLKSPNFAEIYFKLIINSRLTNPAVLPSGGWSSSRAFEIMNSLAQRDGIMHTKWRYTVTFVSDTRSPAERRLAQIKLNHAMTTMDMEVLEGVLNDARSIVGYANLGQVSFTTEADDPAVRVTHRLFWYAHDLNGESLPVLMDTIHEAPLTQPTVSERPELSQWLPASVLP